MATRALQVVITGDKSSLDRALKGVDQRVEHSEGRLKKFGKAGALALGGIGVAAGAGAIGLKKVADAAIESEKSQARMVTQLRASSISYRRHAEEIDRVIGKHSRLSGLDDEELQDAFTNIVRVTGDVDKGLRLTGLAADFARAKHMDVAKAGELVGKVAGGNTGILGRYGIKIKEGASATEALGILQQKFAGQAEAYGRTTAGSLDRASVASENLQEVVGAKLTPLLAKAATAFLNLIDKSGDLAGPIRRVTGTIRNSYDSVVDAVRRFMRRNREDINEVIETFRRLGRFARNVFEDVLVPVVRRVLPVLRGVFEGIVTALRGVMRVVTGIVNGDWKRVWEGVKDIARGAVRAMQSIYRGLWRGLRDAIKALAPLAAKAAVTVGKAIGEGVLAGAKSALTGGGDGGLKDQILDNLPGLGPARRLGKIIGDGVGKKVLPPLPASGVGGLQGADPDLAPFAAVGARFGLHVSSGFRPGSITSSGNKSYHASGDAIDLSGPASGMMRTFRYLKKNFGSRLRELIYTPGGAGINNGRPFTYTGQVAADHHDHVHVAYTGPFGDGPGRSAALQTVADAAQRAGILPKILYGVWGAESNFSMGPGPTSPAGAQGPFQFMPATAQSMGVNPGNFNSAAYGAARYLAQYKSRGVAGMLAAYNAGPAGNPNNPETRAYIPKVLAIAARWPGVDGRSSRGGAPGASGGGGGAARNFREAQRAGRKAAGEAVGSAREAAGEERAAGRELPAARLGVRRAKAEARDDLSGLIKVMVDERKAKRRRLRAIRKVLKRRINKKRRVRLLNEEAELIAEIGDLNESIKEYKADQAGGATTITRAEELEAGVDPNAADAAAGGGGDAGGGTAPAEPDPNIALLAEYTKQLVDNQELIKRLIQTQKDAWPGIMAAIISGEIGGKVGLGFQSTGYAPGTVAAY